MEKKGFYYENFYTCENWKGENMRDKKGRLQKGNTLAFNKGNIPWNKTDTNIICVTCGIKRHVKPAELAEAKYCSRKCKNLAMKVRMPWNKGKRIDRAKFPNFGHFKEHSGEAKKKMSAVKQGVAVEEWKEFKNTENRRERLRFQNTIQRQVLERDLYTCQLCGTRGGILHVDHIQKFSEYVEGRFSMDNCRTVCRACHYQITFGRPMPTNSKWGISFLPSSYKSIFKERGGETGN